MLNEDYYIQVRSTSNLKFKNSNRGSVSPSYILYFVTKRLNVNKEKFTKKSCSEKLHFDLVKNKQAKSSFLLEVVWNEWNEGGFADYYVVELIYYY